MAYHDKQDLKMGVKMYKNAELRSVSRSSTLPVSSLPVRSRRGLAVIDWEEWRPLWVRNWGSKHIYKTLSVSHARQKKPSLTALQANIQAKKQFQVRGIRHCPVQSLITNSLPLSLTHPLTHSFTHSLTHSLTH